MTMAELDADYPLAGTVGVDEVGRGPLCGPVTAAAVWLDPARSIAGLDDSKVLTARRREALAERIREEALCWAVAWCSVSEIDRYNILRASHMAMHRALTQLAELPEHILIDGNRVPDGWADRAVAIVRGDHRHSAIAAASILAKVERDAQMAVLDRTFPGYELAANKGYPTAAHRAALQQLGPCSEHRRSFAPVRAALSESERSRGSLYNLDLDL